MPKRFDCEDEPNDFMEMPCRCDCGKWFDLNDGHRSERDINKVICGECGDKEEKELEREEQIEHLKNTLSDAEYDMKRCKEELKKLGIETDPPPPTSAEDEAKALYPDAGSVEARIAADYSLNDVRKSERSAHITCAGMYTGEIERLKALFKEFWDSNVAEPCKRQGASDELIEKHWQEYKAKHNL